MLLSFAGRVALVTGAGGGLGKSYAMMLADKGASVVVNDLGSSLDGEGVDRRAADQVVNEIQKRGGIAIANYDSVLDGDMVVKTAIDNFGRIDIVINNAGILRDKSFSRLTDDDWEAVNNVHLLGAFRVTRAAWQHMKSQRYGKVVLTSSMSGIYGNFGQANYSAAKLGLVGLGNTLALEGKRHRISVNCVAPVAGSRLTESLIPRRQLEELQPEHVCPVVLYLCHEACPETGGLFEVAGGWAAKVRWQKSGGKLMRSGGGRVTVEDVARHWDRVIDFSNPSYSRTTDEVVGDLMSLIAASSGRRSSKPEEAECAPEGLDPTNYVNRNAAIRHKYEPVPIDYSARDVILYALSLGVTTQRDSDLRFLYENHAEFSPLPGYAFLLGGNVLNLEFVMRNPGLSHLDVTKILHGEHYLEVFRPLPASGRLTSSAMVSDVVDKKSGAAIVIEVDTSDEDGNLIAKKRGGQPLTILKRLLKVTSLELADDLGVCMADQELWVWSQETWRSAIGIPETSSKDTRLDIDNADEWNQILTFVAGAGNFGGPRTSDLLMKVAVTPTTQPDIVVEETTNSSQAAMYRLNGDWNPLHIDPTFAAMGGFPRPILHGLCSLGISVKHVMNAVANGDPSRIKSVKTRFAGIVLPGQTIVTEMWVDANTVYFVARVKETGILALTGGFVKLTEPQSKL